jgi:hypothetical protein
MTIFIVALPISCFVALINNYIELKVDGWKLLNVFQRPLPKIAEDIGTWQAVFSLVALIAIITNAGLICFTMSILDDFKLTFRIWVFFAFQWALIITQQIIAYVVPDEPRDFITQRNRQKFIVSKVIDLVPDEVDEPAEIGENTSYAAFEVAIQTYPKEQQLDLGAIKASI